MLTEKISEEIEKEWEQVKSFFAEKFTDGEQVTVETMLFLIGVQELGQGRKNFSKDEKIDLMHMATCKLLEPFGYFKLERVDESGWKYYTQEKAVSDLKKQNQYDLFRVALVRYFRENVWN